MGACTWKEIKIGSLGNLRVKIGDLTMSSSYATGGDTAAASLFGLSEVLFLDSIVIHGATGVAVSPVFTGGTYQGLMQALFTTGGGGSAPSTLIAPAGTTSGTTTAITAATATGPISITPGIGKEVAATANLTTVIARCMVYGF